MTVYLTCCMCYLLGFHHLLIQLRLICQLGCLIALFQLHRRYLFLALYAVSIPHHDQDAPFPTPESTVGFNREFQGDGSDWVPSGSLTSFPSVQGELPAFREFSMLVSGSAQAPPAGVAGPAQPTEVRPGARFSFDLPPSNPSKVDLTLEEDGDSVVSTPLVADWTLISIVTFIYANNPNLVFFLLHLSLRSAGSELIFRVYPSRAVSSAFPSLSHSFSGFGFWSVKLVGVGRSGGLHSVWVTLRGPCALRFSLFAGCEPFSFDHIEFCSLY